MGDIYSVDSAFLIYAFILQIFFSFMTFFISVLSLKVYKISKRPQPKSMAMAFFLIFISYAIQAFFNLLVLLGTEHDIYVLMGLHPLSAFNNFGVHFHILFMTIGLAFLMYTVFKTDNSSILWYLVLSSLMILFLSRNMMTGFFMLTSLYLGFLSYHFFANYLKKKKKAALLIAMAFFFIFIGHLEFLFISTSTFFYILAHASTFVGYVLILFNYYLIRK